MIRRSFFFAPLAALAITGAIFGSPDATAQNEFVLAEVYGRGVHAYFAGQYDQANMYLTSAIDGGTRDPRAFYFRGMVANSRGLQDQAESDWLQGAKMEAAAGGGDSIGRSLSRFQGSARLKLEEIRQIARMEALMTASARSDTRMRELGVDPAAPVPSAQPRAAAPVAPAPPAPTAPAVSDPFADDGPAMAGGQPKLDSPNALDGLDDNPFKDDALDAAAGGADAGAMGGGDNSNPFGGPAAPAADNANPFGTPPAGGEDPFGGNPFGN